jgi:hypothetical protein
VVSQSIYVLPEQGEDAALDAISADQSLPSGSRGEMRWDPYYGWETAEELAARHSRGTRATSPDQDDACP